jgi:hypothetical protein
MFGVIGKATARRALAVGTGLATIGFGIAVLAPAQAVAQDHEITVTVTDFKALDRADDLSDGDFFARLVIDGKTAVSPTLSGQKEFKPDWKLTLPAKAGVNNVKLELIDKDVSVDDPVDINKLDKKRDLDFTVDTRTGKIEGLSKAYKAGQTITRAGGEKKKAVLSFVVAVK